MIKVIAARKGLELGTHRSVSEFMSNLDKEIPELGLWDMFIKARELHSNFYEDELPPERVKQHSEAVKELIEKLRRIQVT